MPSAKTNYNGLRLAVSIWQIFKRWSGRSCTISHEDASLHCDGTDYPCTATDPPDRSCAISHEDACLVMWRPRFSGYGTRPLGFQGNALQSQCFFQSQNSYTYKRRATCILVVAKIIQVRHDLRQDLFFACTREDWICIGWMHFVKMHRQWAK